MHVELTWNLRFGMRDAVPSKLNVYTLFPVMLIIMSSTETTTAVDCMLMKKESKLFFKDSADYTLHFVKIADMYVHQICSIHDIKYLYISTHS